MTYRRLFVGGALGIAALLVTWLGGDVDTAQAVAACTRGLDSTIVYSDYCPNLMALPARDIQLTKKGNRTRLLFSTISVNIGAGPLELRGGDIVSGKSKQTVYQRIYNAGSPSGIPQERPVGDFVYHPKHRHFHLDDYAYYELIPLTVGDNHRRTGVKTSFCIMDSATATTISAQFGVPIVTPFGIDDRHYTTCGGSLQGMSRGWGDIYGYTLAGQQIDVTGLPNDDYTLRITVNPNGSLFESTRGDNVNERTIRLNNGVLTVFP